MTTRDEVLHILQSSGDEYVSGQELARRVDRSRNAVWRAVKSLEREGYGFSAVTNRGYRLVKKPDGLNLDELKKRLPPQCGDLKIHLYKSVASTNTLLKAMAEEGAPEGTLLMAEEQTAGRGRMNRKFYSPAGTGVYMSLLLRPWLTPEKSLYITTAAAVATAEAIEGVTRRPTRIKWVNDVYMDGKKVCGILTEASFNMESKRLAYVVVGWGMNMREPEGGFPPELQSIVTAVFGRGDFCAERRDDIVAETMGRFWNFYVRLEEKNFLEGYRKRSLLCGRAVDVISATGRRPARAMEIDDEFRLHVFYPDGSDEYLQSGEVSVKPTGARNDGGLHV